MAEAAMRTVLTRVMGILVVLGAAICLLFVAIFSLGYSLGITALIPAAYLFGLVLLGIGTVLAQHHARLALSIVLPLQACGLIVYVINKTARAGQVCDFSCYAGPLEAIALPVALSVIAAWVIYPGLTPSSET